MTDRGIFLFWDLLPNVKNYQVQLWIYIGDTKTKIYTATIPENISFCSIDSLPTGEFHIKIVSEDTKGQVIASAEKKFTNVSTGKVLAEVLSEMITIRQKLESMSEMDFKSHVIQIFNKLLRDDDFNFIIEKIYYNLNKR
jgi:hypothetical protein